MLQQLRGTAATQEVSDVASSSLLRAVVDPLGNATSFAYNRQGEVKAMIDANGIRHAYDYDERGRLRHDRVTNFDSRNPAWKSLDGRVRHIEFRYDDLYGLQNVSCFGPDQRGVETQLNDVHRTFTLLGQLKAERQDHGLGEWIATDHRLRWEDRVSQYRLTPIVEFAYDNDQPTTAAGAGRRSAPGWNHARRKFIQYPGKRRIYYKYEDTRGAPNVGLNRVRELREWLTLHYGVRNKPHQPRLAGYSYLGVDQIQGVERPHPDTDTSISWQLDQGGYLPPAGPRLSTLDAFDRPKQFTSHLESRGDFVNTQIRELEEIVYDYDRHSNVTGRGTENYVYDDLQRMTHATSDGEVRGHWQLDDADNWNAYFENYTALEGSNTAAYRQKREHDQANRTGDMSINGTVPLLQPAYDAVGNMTRLPKLPDGKKVLYCQYDFWNRLVRVHEGERNSQTGRFETRKLVEYDYDGLGRRIVRRAYDGEKAPQETRHYYYNDNWQVLNEWVEVPQQDRTVKLRLDREYVWGIRGPNDLILCDTEHNRLGLPQGMLYPLQDLNWNTTRLYRPVEGDSKFELVEQYAYDPYGRVSMFDKDGNAIAGSSVGWDVLFGGYHYDELTGLYLARNRVYDPGLGRWLQEDPLGFTDSFNLYQYGLSNPATYYDPSGEGWFIPVLIFGAIVLGTPALIAPSSDPTVTPEQAQAIYEAHQQENINNFINIASFALPMGATKNIWLRGLLGSTTNVSLHATNDALTYGFTGNPAYQNRRKGQAFFARLRSGNRVERGA